MPWNREVDVRGPAGPEGELPTDAARRSDPGYPKPVAENIVEVVDSRGAMTFVVARGSDGAPTRAAGQLIARTLTELGYDLDGGGGPGGDGAPAGPIIALGDSMTADDAWLQVLEDGLLIPVRDAGLAGQTSTEVAFRSGALAVSMTVAGDQIPASGSVAVTALAPSSDWRTGVSVQWTERGTLAGVPGTFRHQNASNGGATFVRDAPGSVVSCPPGTRFYVTPDEKTGVGYERCPATIWVGRNNHTSLANIQRDIQAMVTRFPNTKLILSVTNTQNEPAGSAGYQAVMAINSWLATTFPSRYVNVRRWLIDDALRVMGLTPTAADTTAIGEDRIPPQLMNDDTHITPAASAALGGYLTQVYRQKGI